MTAEALRLQGDQDDGGHSHPGRGEADGGAGIATGMDSRVQQARRVGRETPGPSVGDPQANLDGTAERTLAVAAGCEQQHPNVRAPASAPTFDRLPAAIWQHVAEVGLSGVVVFAALVSHFPREAKLAAASAWPSIRRLCDLCRLTRRPLQVALGKLEHVGLLEREPSMGPGGVSVYRLGPAALESVTCAACSTPRAASSAPPCREQRAPRAVTSAPHALLAAPKPEPLEREPENQRNNPPPAAAPAPPVGSTGQQTVLPGCRAGSAVTSASTLTPAGQMPRTKRTSPAATPEEVAIFDSYRATLREAVPSAGPRTLTSKVLRVIQQARDMFTDEDVLDATRGWAFDPWSVEHNHELGWILRENNLERYRDMQCKPATRPRPTSGSRTNNPNGDQTHAAYMETLERKQRQGAEL